MDVVGVVVVGVVSVVGVVVVGDGEVDVVVVVGDGLVGTGSPLRAFCSKLRTY
jgi:hypothetical protein